MILSGHGNVDAPFLFTTSKTSLAFQLILSMFQSLKKSRESRLSRLLSHSPSLRILLLTKPRSGTSTSLSRDQKATHSETSFLFKSESASQSHPKTKSRSTSLPSSSKNSILVLSRSAPRQPLPTIVTRQLPSSTSSKAKKAELKSERNSNHLPMIRQASEQVLLSINQTSKFLIQVLHTLLLKP